MEWAMKKGLTDGTNPKEHITLERFITILYIDIIRLRDNHSSLFFIFCKIFISLIF